MKTSPRIYVRVTTRNGRFVSAYWPVRKVENKSGRVTIHYHARSRVTFDTATYHVTCDADMWDGPLSGTGVVALDMSDVDAGSRDAWRAMKSG